MMSEEMTYDAFETLVSAYGGTPENWPNEQRDAMQQFLSNDKRAAALLAREARLDGWLDARLPDAAPVLHDKILTDMAAAFTEAETAENSADIVQIDPLTDPLTDAMTQMSVSRRAYGAAISVLAACFVLGFVAAPSLFDMMEVNNDLFAAIDIISDNFLPNDPL